jgi:hypothetical protein
MKSKNSRGDSRRGHAPDRASLKSGTDKTTALSIAS